MRSATVTSGHASATTGRSAGGRSAASSRAVSHAEAEPSRSRVTAQGPHHVVLEPGDRAGTQGRQPLPARGFRPPGEPEHAQGHRRARQVGGGRVVADQLGQPRAGHRAQRRRAHEHAPSGVHDPGAGQVPAAHRRADPVGADQDVGGVRAAVGEPHPDRAVGLPLEPRELRPEPDHVVQAGQQHRPQQRPVDLPAGPGARPPSVAGPTRALRPLRTDSGCARAARRWWPPPSRRAPEAGTRAVPTRRVRRGAG